MNPDKAFILAAGFGKRLRPFTDTIPKPLVEVGDAPMIDQALDKLRAAGVQRCVVNTHYKADILAEHLQSRTSPNITISHEAKILDTGGGIKNAIQHFDAPFFILSGDSVWEDAPNETALNTLAKYWDSEKMDILMLLQPVETMHLTQGVGDYNLDENGQATRSLDKTGTHMFTSIRINAPHIFDNAPDEPFNYRDLMDEAQAKGRLYGLVHHGHWHHISTPEDLDTVNKAFENKRRSA